MATTGLDAYGRIWDLRTGRNIMCLEGSGIDAITCFSSRLAKVEISCCKVEGPRVLRQTLVIIRSVFRLAFTSVEPI